MNLIEHAFWALAIQTVVGLFTRNWWAGAALACGYFLGREMAQAEYRWIEQFGHGLRANMPWWGAFDGRVWPKADQFADWIGPIVSTCSLALVMRRRRKCD
ncbi:hypothetical protein [Novosphingobium pentaromativorans]|uniref:Transmembrane protein n=1 Tax=Novosphingobium pentaromativorans US6-1 TaxID=1088721 RepID=G6EKK9_9SPHN|nr:hypothetical protein [Novosphingobium pentaromativorans]AIT82801.1 hypothetical protein JI59_25520 [Novosphingobium pentaromativorans US6-1]EHJ58165.1 hypothetical protein NSU_4880 [Novosphingobium pentaromativorans US6-1]